jgi:hypothetical protein
MPDGDTPSLEPGWHFPYSSAAMISRLSLLILLFLFCGLASAVAEDFDPIPLIGLDLPGAVGAVGLPQRMFAYRGVEEGQDNVVFYYPDYRYLFWYKDRVWQVRCDRRFTGHVFGLGLGMSRDEVEKASQRQLVPNGDSLYFDLDGAKFPLRVRLVFAADVLTDLYVYRSDF